jgi:hypothetical protein
MPSIGLICSQCNDVADTITPLNVSTLLAKSLTVEIIVALDTRREGAWAEKSNCERLMPLRRIRRRYPSRSVPGSATVVRAFPLVT